MHASAFRPFNLLAAYFVVAVFLGRFSETTATLGSSLNNKEESISSNQASSSAIAGPSSSQGADRRRQRLITKHEQHGNEESLSRDLTSNSTNSSGTEGKQCVGSKFTVVIRFDIFPEDFSMTLVNDDDDSHKNRTVWGLDDPARNYSAPHYRFATVTTGVCLPRNRCWLLTVYDNYGDGMVGPNPDDVMEPGSGGGIRLFFNSHPMNYYTGKYNGCYRKMWFRFGEYCSSQNEFGHVPGNCEFKVGKAPNDGWFTNDLYPDNIERVPTPAPVPTPPTTPSPVRIGPTDRPSSRPD